jgi:hypothetical protein
MTPTMSSAPTTTLPAVQTDGPVADGACAVCSHPLVAHDAISLRYCRATEAQAATGRGCVCPSK